MTTTENPKLMIRYLKTIELEVTSETRKTSKVRPYAIPTVHYIEHTKNFKLLELQCSGAKAPPCSSWDTGRVAPFLYVLLREAFKKRKYLKTFDLFAFTPSLLPIIRT